MSVGNSATKRQLPFGSGHYHCRYLWFLAIIVNFTTVFAIVVVIIIVAIIVIFESMSIYNLRIIVVITIIILNTTMNINFVEVVNVFYVI